MNDSGNTKQWLNSKMIRPEHFICAYGEMAAARVLGSLVFQDVQVQILLGTPNSSINNKKAKGQSIMKLIISTTPFNGVLTDITLDKGEDKGDVMEIVGNSMIETTADYLNNEKMSKKMKEAYVESLCKVMKENILKKLK